MDPVTLAVITSAVTLAGNQALGAAATEAGKASWAQLMKVFGWTTAPAQQDLARLTAERLKTNPELGAPVLQLLKQDAGGSVGMLVGHIDADKVVVAHTIQTLNM